MYHRIGHFAIFYFKRIVTVSSTYIWSKTFSYFSYAENEAKNGGIWRPVPDLL